MFTDLIKNKKLFLDTNIFIYLLDETEIYFPQIRQLFKSIELGENRAITSVISPLEVLSTKKLITNVEKEAEYSNFFVNTENLSVMDVDYYTCNKAAEMRRLYGFRVSDAIQLASSIVHKCDLLITNDYKFKVQDKILTLSVADLPL